ncbi:stealth family protein [Streptomyces sp. NPDC048603]|uniref:stealth family protein n=1 Tax=Streptomyces sp. NPDC048603 TaxID=3365577 RepID=UPI003722D653
MTVLSRFPLPKKLRRVARAALRRTPLRPGVPRQPTVAQRERLDAPSASAAPTAPARTREDELLETLTGVVRHRGRLAVVRDDLLPAGARDANLRTAAEALEAAGLPYGLVPDGGLLHRVAVAPGDREPALKALAEACTGLPVYAVLLGDGGELAEVLAERLPEAVTETEHPDRQPAPPTSDSGRNDTGEDTPGRDDAGVTGQAPADPARQVKGIRLHQPVVTTGRTVHYGSDHGCDLEFWDPDNDGTGGVAALRETPYGWWVPSLTATTATRVGDRDYPVVDAFVRSFAPDVDFPVDAVITWVDASDPDWRRRRRQTRAALDGTAAPVDDAEHRYRDRGELRHCLRAIAAYAPWIRRIFLVTDNPVPDWLVTDHPGLTVVTHQELFADPGALPVFNSHAIESQLHRIPGLAEHFLYFNDDIFLGRPQLPGAYFLPSGLPKVFHDWRAIPPDVPGSEDDVYTASQKATRRAVEAAAGRTYVRILAHTPYPLSRSLCTAAEERFPEELTATSRSAFRSATDLAPVTLAAHLALATGRAVEGDLAHEYFGTGWNDTVHRLPELVHHRWADAFCLADDDGDELSADEQHRAVAAFLAAYFPVPSPYEHGPQHPGEGVPGDGTSGDSGSGAVEAAPEA